jgi:hypothetical protein
MTYVVGQILAVRFPTNVEPVRALIQAVAVRDRLLVEPLNKSTA